MALHECKVQWVRHWTDKTFSFRMERPQSFKFRNGEFAMIGLMVDGKPLLRAYSIASPNWADYIEFLSIKVPDGPLTSRLQHLEVGDTVLMNSKAVGTLCIDSLQTGGNLYLLATGTGLAPYMSIIQDPETYDAFNKVVLVHTVRTTAEHAYRNELLSLKDHEILGELLEGKFVYVPTVTREMDTSGFAIHGRCSGLFKLGHISKECLLEPFNVNTDAAMVCGSTAMNTEFIEYFESIGGKCGTANERGCYVYEKAFVD
jgi:ferredoxin--NADP+ reductase